METAYCVRCKKKVNVLEGYNIVKTKKGLRRLAGKCSICGTKVSKILGK